MFSGPKKTTPSYLLATKNQKIVIPAVTPAPWLSCENKAALPSESLPPLDTGTGACTGGGGGGAGPGGGGGALPPPTDPTDVIVAGGFYNRETNFEN